jgi:hypothetical protein
MMTDDKKKIQKVFNGDKDIFRFIFLITGQPFYFVPYFPGYSSFGDYRDCLTHYFGHEDTAETPMFSINLRREIQSRF